jgi:hypothetical protein
VSEFATPTGEPSGFNQVGSPDAFTSRSGMLSGLYAAADAWDAAASTLTNVASALSTDSKTLQANWQSTAATAVLADLGKTITSADHGSETFRQYAHNLRAIAAYLQKIRNIKSELRNIWRLILIDIFVGLAAIALGFVASEVLGVVFPVLGDLLSSVFGAAEDAGLSGLAEGDSIPLATDEVISASQIPTKDVGPIDAVEPDVTTDPGPGLGEPKPVEPGNPPEPQVVPQTSSEDGNLLSQIHFLLFLPSLSLSLYSFSSRSPWRQRGQRRSSRARMLVSMTAVVTAALVAATLAAALATHSASRGGGEALWRTSAPSTDLASSSTPVGTGSGGGTGSEGADLTLAAQSAWVRLGGRLTLHLGIAAPVTRAHLRLSVVVDDRLTTRSALVQTFRGVPESPAIDTIGPLPLSDLPTDAVGDRVLSVDVLHSGVPAPATTGTSAPTATLHLYDCASCTGVYPVQVELTDTSGARLARFTTEMVVVPPTAPAEPLQVSWVLPFGGTSLPVTPAGKLVATSKEVAQAGTIADALASDPDVPVTLAPSPATLEALAADPSGHRGPKFCFRANGGLRLVGSYQ